MDIAIVTGAFGGYGRWLVQWTGYVAALDPSPAEAVAVLGYRHGATLADIRLAREILPGLRIVKASRLRHMGSVRNAAVAAAGTEWVQWLSVDDGILPDAIAAYERPAQRADWLCTGWLTRGLGQRETRHRSPLPVEMARRRGRGFVIGHSPFRRALWEQVGGYPAHDYPNAPFLASMVEAGARFVRISRPITIYLRRPDSHSRTVLQGPRRSMEEKRKAIMYKCDMQRRVVAYYRAEKGGAKP
jgi:hypothetical protein